MRKFVGLMFCGCLALPASAAPAAPLQSYEQLLRQHRYAQAEKGLTSVLGRVNEPAKRARVYGLLASAAMGQREEKRALDYLEREAAAFDQAHLVEDAFAARLQWVESSHGPHAVAAMHRLEELPRPKRQANLFNFYLVRSRLASGLTLQEKNLQAALEAAASPSQRGLVYGRMALVEAGANQLVKARESLKKANDLVRFVEDSTV